MAASAIVGAQGCIYAFDPWEEGIETLQTRAAVADAALPLPIDDRSVDLGLTATISHVLLQEGKIHEILAELVRVLGPDGIVGLVDFRKIKGPPGSPLSLRHSPRELAAIFLSHGFFEIQSVDVGPYNCLSLFRIAAGQR